MPRRQPFAQRQHASTLRSTQAPKQPAASPNLKLLRPARRNLLVNRQHAQPQLQRALAQAREAPDEAWIALKGVPDPGRYGVAELHGRKIVGIEEKPARPKSRYAVAGIYFYPPDVFEVIRHIPRSARGELEITDVNRHYLQEGRLRYKLLKGYWTDAGTPDSLALANELVRKSPPRY